MDGNFAGGFAQGFSNANPLQGFYLNQQKKQKQKEQEQVNLQKEAEFVNKTLNELPKQFEPIVQQRQTVPSTPVRS